MVRNLIPIGSSLGIIIPKPVLELLKMDKDASVEISTDGEKLIIQRTKKKSRRDEVREQTKQLVNEHRELFRKLSK